MRFCLRLCCRHIGRSELGDCCKNEPMGVADNQLSKIKMRNPVTACHFRAKILESERSLSGMSNKRLGD